MEINIKKLNDRDFLKFKMANWQTKQTSFETEIVQKCGIQI